MIWIDDRYPESAVVDHWIAVHPFSLSSQRIRCPRKRVKSTPRLFLYWALAEEHFLDYPSADENDATKPIVLRPHGPFEGWVTRLTLSMYRGFGRSAV